MPFAGQAADIHDIRAQCAGVNRKLDGIIDSIDFQSGFFVAHRGSWDVLNAGHHYKVS